MIHICGTNNPQIAFFVEYKILLQAVI